MTASGYRTSAQSRLEALALRARRIVDAEVAALLDLSRDHAEVAVSGELLECTPDKEALLMLWMQEPLYPCIRQTPPKLLLVFGCLEVLLVPIETPAGRLGVLALSLTQRVLPVVKEIESFAAEIALELEAEGRRADRARRRQIEMPTDPAPPIDQLDEVA